MVPCRTAMKGSSAFMIKKTYGPRNNSSDEDACCSQAWGIFLA